MIPGHSPGARRTSRTLLASCRSADQKGVVREISVGDERPVGSVRLLRLPLLFQPLVIHTVGEPVSRPVRPEGLRHAGVDEGAELAFEALQPVMRLVGAGEAF